MTKAEEWALKHFPVEMVLALGPDDKPVEVDANRHRRELAAKVYAWALEDIANTPVDTELNAQAYLTELGYTLIPPGAKFSRANVATLAKHLLVWAEQAPKDKDSGWEDYRREIIKELAINAISESCSLTSEYITNRSDISKAVKNAKLVADMVVKQLKEEEE